MTAVLFVLAFIGLVVVLAGLGLWLLFPEDANDVDVRERLAPFVERRHAQVHTTAEPSCEACAGIDRGGF